MMFDDRRASRDVDVTRSRSSSPAQVDARGRAPSDEARAAETVTQLEDDVQLITPRARDAHAAADHNDPEAYHKAIDTFGQAKERIAAKQAAFESLRGKASADVRDRYDHAAKLAKETLDAPLPEAPTGIVRLSVEGDFLRILKAPINGPARDAYDRLEAQLRVLITNLSTADTLALSQRLKREAPSDELVSALKRLSSRLPGLVKLLEDDKRRARVRHREETEKAQEARQAASHAKAKQADATHTAAQDHAKGTAYAPVANDASHAAAQIATDVEFDEDARANTKTSARLVASSAYASIHWPAFMAMARQRLLATGLSPGHPRVRWATGLAEVIGKLGDAFGAATGDLPALLHPNDPWRLINDQRMSNATGDELGPIHWVPGAGAVIAAAIEHAFAASLPRMSGRYAIATDQGSKFEPVLASRLVLSHPFDSVVARLLCTPGLVEVAPPGKAERTAKPGHDVQRDGVRNILKHEWLGELDPAMWTWVRVTDPIDATPEEVAELLWPASSSFASGTQLAYGLVQAGNLFGMPEEWARQHPIGKKLAPPAGSASTSPELVLAGSVFADDVALAQASSHVDPKKHAVPAGRAAVLDHLEAVGHVLDYVHPLLDPWSASAQLRPAARFAKAKRAWAATAAPDELARWAAVFERQHAVVDAGWDKLRRALAQLEAVGYGPEKDPDSPVTTMVRTYAEGLGTSHVADTALQLIASAERQRAGLAVRQLQEQASGSRNEVARLPTTAPEKPTWIQTHAAEVRKQLAPQQAALDQRTAALHGQAIAGHAPDAQQIEDTELERREIALRARIANLQSGLGELRQEVRTADEGAVATISSAIFGDYISLTLLEAKLDRGIVDLVSVEDVLARATATDINKKYDAFPPSDGRELARNLELRQQRRLAVDKAQAMFSATLKRDGLDAKLFEKAAEAIHDAKLHALLVNIGAMIGVAIASAGIASVAGDFAAGVAGGARTAATVADAASVARTARIAGSVTNFIVDAGVNAAGQTALQGGNGGSTFLENVFTNAAVLAALKPLQAIARSWGALDEEAFKLWEQQGQKWKLVAAKGTYVTAELITSAAVGYVTHRVMTAAKGEKPDDVTLASWAAQGATMVLGRYVHARLGDSMERLKLLGRAAGDLVGRTGRQMVLAGKVEHAGSVDAGMELFVEHNRLFEDEIAVWRKIASDPAALQHLGLTREQVDVRLHGAEAQQAELHSQAFAHLQLRLAGLQQEGAGGPLWVGDTEDIAFALAQAKRAGFKVEVEHVALLWRVKLDGESLEIRERARDGRVREAKPASEITPEDVAHARRYAAAARELRVILEEHYKGIVEREPDFATETLRLGFGFAAVAHGDTRFEHGQSTDPHEHLILYMGEGPMLGRGDLRSGQSADLQTMPGVRTREHTLDHDAFTRSRDLGDATEVGRLEMQTPSYRGEVISQIESREAKPGSEPRDPWKHADKGLRVRVKSDGGKRWIYFNRYENVGGMGPTNFGGAKQVVGGPNASPNERTTMIEEMQTRKVLLGADDPELSKLLQPGEHVLVWGGSPSGAWAGEDASMHGAKQTDIVGESAKKRDANMPKDELTAEEFQKVLARAIREGDNAKIAQLKSARIAQTHTGSALRRNREPGAPYGPGAEDRGIHVEIGVPTEITLLPNGKVRVVLGVSQDPTPRIYDRVIVGHGQDPGAPGGAGWQLGKGAKVKLGPDGQPEPVQDELPDGTIGLHMVRDKNGRVVGLESANGRVQLIGAAYAQDKLAPWVVAAERAEFIREVRKIGDVNDRTHTGNAISDDSRLVTTGIETQPRDRIPVRNEVIGARDYRLPKQASADRLSLPPDHPEEWAERVEHFLVASMRARPGRLQVVPQVSGRDGVHVFRVYNGGEDVGLFRVYDSMTLAEAEAQIAHRVKDAVPSLDVGAERGTMAIEGGQTAQLSSHALDGRTRATTFDDLVTAWQSATNDAARTAAFDKLNAAVVRTAHTLAELHKQFAHEGASMSSHAKQQLIDATYRKLDAARAASGMQPAELTRIRERLRPLADDFMKANVPATAELGHADVSAFAFREYNATGKEFGRLSIEEVARVHATLDPATGRGTGTGAADVAEFLESLARHPGLGETANSLRDAFLLRYEQVLGASSVEVSRAQPWFEATINIDRLARGEPGAGAHLDAVLSRNEAP